MSFYLTFVNSHVSDKRIKHRHPLIYCRHAPTYCSTTHWISVYHKRCSHSWRSRRTYCICVLQTQSNCV